MRIAAGATGALLGSDLLLPGLALAHSSEPRPIPGGERFLGPGTELFHVFGIGPGVEESTITDFHGSIGAAQIQGKGRGMNTQTGDTSRLLFDVDMRFMQGTYIGMDGREHYGTFSFIWLDLYKGQVAPKNQIHDFNPGFVVGGLFWTVRVPDESVEVDLDDATASISLSDFDTRDFLAIPNALTHGKSIEAEVSFDIHWHDVKKRLHLHDPKNHYDASVIEDNATMRWSAHEEDFSFVSDDEDTSTTVFAEIRHERNGVFFDDTED